MVVFTWRTAVSLLCLLGSGFLTWMAMMLATKPLGLVFTRLNWLGLGAALFIASLWWVQYVCIAAPTNTAPV